MGGASTWCRSTTDARTSTPRFPGMATDRGGVDTDSTRRCPLTRTRPAVERILSETKRASFQSHLITSKRPQIESFLIFFPPDDETGTQETAHPEVSGCFFIPPGRRRRILAATEHCIQPRRVSRHTIGKVFSGSQEAVAANQRRMTVFPCERSLNSSDRSRPATSLANDQNGTEVQSAVRIGAVRTAPPDRVEAIEPFEARGSRRRSGILSI